MCDCNDCNNESALPIGPTGATGNDGLSAYEIAVENGFVGNEAAWLASLVADSLFEEGSGTDAIQTKDNGANASGDGALSIGKDSLASGFGSVALGLDAQSAALDTIAIGDSTEAGTDGAIAIGSSASAVGENSTAIGVNAINSIDYTTQIQGCIITRKDLGEGNPERNFTGAVVTIASEEVDLKSAPGTGTSITLPSNCKFYLDSVDLIITSANNVTVQPFIRIGITGTVAKFLAITSTTGLTAIYDRQRFNTLLSAAGESSLRYEVTTAATATTMKGRFIFKGILVENE